MNVNTYLSGASVGLDQTASWANSALINTAATDVIFTVPDSGMTLGEYMLTIRNPSTGSDLNVDIFSMAKSIGGSDSDSYITSITVPKKANRTNGKSVECYSFFIHGILNASNLKLVLSNNTAIAADGAFSATIRLKEML